MALTGCGASDESGKPSVDAGEHAGEACGDGAVGDPADLSADRVPTRCEPGLPGAKPLEARATVKIATAARGEFIAPLLLAEANGEFERENLDVEIVDLPFADAITQVQTGNLDATTGTPEAGFFNAVNGDIELTWVAGNFSPPDAGDAEVPQTGLWAHKDLFSDPEAPDLSELAGTSFASGVGFTSITTYPIAEAAEAAGLGLDDVEVVQIPTTEQVAALQNGAVESAWLVDPFWQEIAEDDDFTLVATQPAGEPLGGFFFGPRLVDEDPEVGIAFTRAIIRTINTYLADDYQDDDEVVAAIAEQTGLPEEAIVDTPALDFDWEIRQGTTDRLQQAFIEQGTVDFASPIEESRVVDRTFYERAVTGE